MILFQMYSREIKMPAKSKAQQRFMGMVHAFKKGELKNAPEAIKKAAKSMKKGDLCFFYHSNIGKEIVGIVEVIKEAYLDKTDKSGRFVAVTVKFKGKLPKPVTLENIKNNKELSHLGLIKQSRLSVMPIDSKSWKIILKMSSIL